MCDYSLEHIESRAAKVGDRLTMSVFSNSITRGFVEEGKGNAVAVCLRPGTEVSFDEDIKADHALGFFPVRTFIGVKTAKFTQINPDDPHQHHDALELSDGRIILLTRLVARQHATVLQLPVVPVKVAELEKAEPVLEPAE